MEHSVNTCEANGDSILSTLAKQMEKFAYDDYMVNSSYKQGTISTTNGRNFTTNDASVPQSMLQV